MNLEPQNNTNQTEISQNSNIDQNMSNSIILSGSDNDNCEYDNWFSDFPIF